MRTSPCISANGSRRTTLSPKRRSFFQYVFFLWGIVGIVLVGLVGCRRDDDIKKLRQQATQASRVPRKGNAKAPTLMGSMGMIRPGRCCSSKALFPSLGDFSKTPIGKGLDGFRLGPKLRYKRLVVYPVLLKSSLPKAKTPMTIDESFRRRKVRVTEEGSGHVPLITLRKRRSLPIFVMTGDMFLGAKQDRISKHDLLLPRASGRHKIPVYCVEQGRWRYGGSSSFRAGNSAGSWRLRRSASKKLSQSEIWRKVSQKTRNLRARTSTQTMAATYRSRLYRKQSPAYLKRLKAFLKKNAEAVGYVGIIKGRVANVEIFANHSLFRKMWPKMSKAMVLDAIDPKYKASAIKTQQLVSLLRKLKSARYEKTQTPGIGREYLITHRQLSGTFLAHNKQLIHLSLFPDDNRTLKPNTRRRIRRLRQLYQQQRPLSSRFNKKGRPVSRTRLNRRGWPKSRYRLPRSKWGLKDQLQKGSKSSRGLSGYQKRRYRKLRKALPRKRSWRRKYPRKRRYRRYPRSRKLK